MRLGLTGGMGCGKSTVLAELACRGARILESDALVRQLLAADSAVHEALRSRFGGAIFLAEGGVDRSKLASIVFNDAAALKDLEKVLHPRVRQEYLSQMDAAPDEFWVVEIPLLFENNLETLFNFCVCIEATVETQLSRLRGRGLTEVEARLRIDRQLPLTEKIRRSDFVVSNNGSLDNLRRQIDLLLNHVAVTLS